MDERLIIDGSNLMKEFMGYVKSEYPVYFHSTLHGFSQFGRLGSYIKREQYEKLVKWATENDPLAIDYFYENARPLGRLPYKYDGEHLFLCAYGNRSTKLDFQNQSLKYNTFDLLMPVCKAWVHLDVTTLTPTGYKKVKRRTIKTVNVREHYKLVQKLEEAVLTYDWEKIFKQLLDNIMWYGYNKKTVEWKQ